MRRRVREVTLRTVGKQREDTQVVLRSALTSLPLTSGVPSAAPRKGHSRAIVPGARAYVA